MTATSHRQLKLGAILAGVGTGPKQFARFRERVVPILQRRGLFRTDCTHHTLRGHLGLPVPEDRWSGSATPWRALAGG